MERRAKLYSVVDTAGGALQSHASRASPRNPMVPGGDTRMVLAHQRYRHARLGANPRYPGGFTPSASSHCAGVKR